MEVDYAALVLSAQKGDKEAFGKIYGEFYPRIYRFIYYLVYDPALAQDLAQSTFLKTWKALSRFDEKKGTLQAFLYAIARNCVIDHQRRKKLVSLEVAYEIPSHEDIQENLLMTESKEIVYKTMGFLTPFEKQLIVLRYFEEMSMAEIATVVSKEEGAVRVRIHRILKKMQSIIKQYTYEN